MPSIQNIQNIASKLVKPLTAGTLTYLNVANTNKSIHNQLCYKSRYGIFFNHYKKCENLKSPQYDNIQHVNVMLSKAENNHIQKSLTNEESKNYRGYFGNGYNYHESDLVNKGELRTTRDENGNPLTYYNSKYNTKGVLAESTDGWIIQKLNSHDLGDLHEKTLDRLLEYARDVPHTYTLRGLRREGIDITDLNNVKKHDGLNCMDTTQQMFLVIAQDFINNASIENKPKLEIAYDQMRKEFSERKHSRPSDDYSNIISNYFIPNNEGKCTFAGINFGT